MEKSQKNGLLLVSKVLLVLTTLIWVAYRLYVSSAYAVFEKTLAVKPLAAFAGWFLPLGALFFSLGLLLEKRVICIIGLCLVLLSNLAEHFGIVGTVMANSPLVTTLGQTGSWCFLLSSLLLSFAFYKRDELSVFCGILAALLLFFGAITYASWPLSASYGIKSFINNVNTLGFTELIKISFSYPFWTVRDNPTDLRFRFALIHTMSYAILFPIASILFGFGAKKEKKSNFTAKTSAASNTNSIDRIINLKTLLDKGIISKEEYETKKKEIIGTE